MSLKRVFQRWWQSLVSARDRAPRRRTHLNRFGIQALEVRVLLSVSVANNSASGYAALSFNQSGGYIPPDTNGAAGPNAYVETVNQTVALFTNKATGGGEVTDSLGHFMFTTGGLTRADGGSGQSDPVITYDDQIGRFIIGDQDINFSTHVSAFDLAVSKTNNPTSLSASDWNFYKITTTESGFDADYPGNLGYNRDALVYTLNMFGVAGGGHVQVVSVNANNLMNGAASPQVFRNDLNDFSVRPTTMHDSVAGDPMWLVTEHGDGQSIDVIKMTNVLSTSASFAYTNLAVDPYAGVVSPLNPNGTVITDNVDSRIMKAAEANNTIVATHAVSVSSTEDDAQWYAIDVSSGTPTLSQQGRISAGNNTYIVYPGIDINSSGQIGMSYMRSGTDSSTDYLSMWVTGRVASDPAGTMQTPVIVPAGTGAGNYSDFTSTGISGGRAGDLSGINVDPSDGSFWATNEFANSQGTDNWGTAVANFTVSAPVLSADMAVTQSGPTTVTAGTEATYNITVTNNGPDAASAVVLTDNLPTGSEIAGITQTQGSDGFVLGQSGSTITESAFADIAPLSTDTFQLLVFAPSTLSPGANFSNAASVSSSTFDPKSSNNSATVTGKIVGPPADLAVANTGPGTAIEGGNITFTVTVSNSGPNAATGVVLTDKLGANLRYVTATTTQGSLSQSNGVVTFNLGTIAVNGSATLKITAKALEEGTWSNTASVTATSADPKTSNNSAIAKSTVSEPAIVVSAPITTSSQSLTSFTVATFTHASGVEAASAFKATINWGDGTTSTGTITLSGTTYTVKGSHRYARPGSHRITTTVTEIGNAALLLLAKKGDEVPGLPDRAPPPHHHHGSSGDDQNNGDGQNVNELAAWFTENTTKKKSEN